MRAERLLGPQGYWKTRTGEALPIATMHPRHRRNAAKMVERFIHQTESESGLLALEPFKEKLKELETWR